MSKRKVLAIVLVLAMVLALPAVAMADNPQKPVKAKDIQTPVQFQSVTIGGETASFQVDGYGTPSNVTWDNDHVFIRALMPTTNTEESLKTQTVIIVLSSGKTIAGGSLINTYTHPSSDPTGTYTFTGVDLLNKAYTIELNDNSTYTIAAGLNDSNRAHVTIPLSDDLYIGGFVYGSGNNPVTADIYRITVQNPCMGNPFFVGNNNQSENGWTFCYYFIKGIDVYASYESSVPITFTKNGNSSISGDISSVSINNNSVTATANLSGNAPVLTVAYNGNSRTYNMVARFHTDGGIWVTYGISFDELHSTADAAYYYEGSPVKVKADQIEEAAIAYFDPVNVLDPYGEVYVAVGTTAMDVIQAFMNSVGYSEYDPNSTYISSINGLGAFDTTGLDGWMYTDSADGWSLNCHLPNYGAADWYLSSGDRITWFYTIDFTQYVNW